MTHPSLKTWVRERHSALGALQALVVLAALQALGLAFRRRARARSTLLKTAFGSSATTCSHDLSPMKWPQWP